MAAFLQESVGSRGPVLCGFWWTVIGVGRPGHSFVRSFIPFTHLLKHLKLIKLWLRLHPSGKEHGSRDWDKRVLRGASGHCWFASREDAGDQRPPSDGSKPFEALNKGASEKVQSLRPEGGRQMKPPGMGCRGAAGRVVAAIFLHREPVGTTVGEEWGAGTERGGGENARPPQRRLGVSEMPREVSSAIVKIGSDYLRLSNWSTNHISSNFISLTLVKGLHRRRVLSCILISQ